MNKIILAAAITSLFSLSVNAQSRGITGVMGQGQTSFGSSVSGSDSVAAANNSGVTQALTFVSSSPAEQIVRNVREGSATEKVEYSGSYKLKNVPSVSGPNLTTSNDTCMGSSSGSANFPGFGFGLGSTWTDKNCVRLKNGRELWNMGQRAASLTLMCNDSEMMDALEMTGVQCPQNMTADERRAAFGPNVSVKGAVPNRVAGTPYVPTYSSNRPNPVYSDRALLGPN